MRYAIYALALLCVCHPRVIASDKEPTARPIDGADSVLAIYQEDHGLYSNGHPAIILAIWPDGYIVWSKDRIKGGAPYYSGRVDPEQVTAVLAEFDLDGLFADKKLNNANFGPDSQFTTLFVKSGKKQVEMRSWHEWAEDDGGAVATSHGITTLQGRRRLEVLSKEPADYLYYRFVWSEARSKMLDLIPVDGKPVSGKPHKKAGDLSWREAPANAKPGDENGSDKK